MVNNDLSATRINARKILPTEILNFRIKRLTLTVLQQIDDLSSIGIVVGNVKTDLDEIEQMVDAKLKYSSLLKMVATLSRIKMLTNTMHELQNKDFKMIKARDALIQSHANRDLLIATAMVNIEEKIKEAINSGQTQCSILIPDGMHEMELMLADYGYGIRKVTTTCWTISWAI